MSKTTEPLPSSGRAALAAERTRQRAHTWQVSVVEGPDRGRKLTLLGALLVGTGEDMGLKLGDPTVSRAHAELVPHGDEVLLRDLGSRNGTFVSGARVQEVLLGEGMDAVLGKTTLRVFRGDPALLEEPQSFGGALSLEPSMLELFRTLERAARAAAAVLLLGETGTGKGLLAKGLHDGSERARGPFEVFDCGAVSRDLIESDLFGHAKGAFTGAGAERRGAFERASGGTLFLDEVGELPLELQPKLLRALAEGTVRRVGDGAARSVDVRVVAATHRDLEAAVRAGRFREDLFFRLAVVQVLVPPLRQRRADIPILARHFVREAQRPEVQLSAPLLARMVAYDWPGNVRELKNVVDCALAGVEPVVSARLSTAASTGPDDLQDLPFKEAKERLLQSFTREYLSGLLERTGGNVSEVARLAGLARSHVHLLLSKLGLHGDDQGP